MNNVSDIASMTSSSLNSNSNLPSSSSLSSDDVVEIRKFAESKSRITDLTENLLAKSNLDPFEGFEQVADLPEETKDSSPSAETISEAWENLEAKLQQVLDWHDERDEIEAEVAQFEVGDMERLRRVAKAASEREMSVHDTDLIEITIQTLVALDALLRLLRSRREALDLLQGRLRWEERRRDCWTTYFSLSHDLDEFVNQSRWSPNVYQRNTLQNESLLVDVDDTKLQGTSPSEWSPTTARSASGSHHPSTSNAKRIAMKIRTQSTALQSRCHSFVNELVPLASHQLDELIEQRKLPDVILDEQDRLEDLAESIKDREAFAGQLALQWRKADEIYRQLRSMHIQGKQLSSSLLSSQRETLSRECLSDFETRSEHLKRKLELLCGAKATLDYLLSNKVSPDLLSAKMQQSVTQPKSKRWPDQEQRSAEVKEALTKELMATAKYIRQASQLTEKYQRSLLSLAKLNELVSELRSFPSVYKYIAARAHDGWIDEAEEPKGSEIKIPTNFLLPASKNGGVPDFQNIDCMLPSSHDVYLERLPQLDSFLVKLKSEHGQKKNAIEQAIRECIQNGVNRSNFQELLDEAIYHADLSKDEASKTMEGVQSKIELLKGTRRIKLRIEQLDSQSRACLKDALRILEAGLQSSEQQEVVPSVDDFQSRSDVLSNERDSIDKDLCPLLETLESVEGANTIKRLEERNSAVTQSVSSLLDIGKWLQSLQEQHHQLKTLESEYKRLSGAGQTIVDTLREMAKYAMKEIQLPEQTTDEDRLDEVAFLPEWETVYHQIHQYASATHSDVTLCGQPPPDLLKAYIESGRDEAQLLATDNLVRNKVNNWCSLLSTLYKDLDTARSEALERQARQKQAREQHRRHQYDLSRFLEEFQTEMVKGKELCALSQTTLDRHEDSMSSAASIDLVEIEQLMTTLKTIQGKARAALQECLYIQEHTLCSAALIDRIKTNVDQHSELVQKSEILQQRSDRLALVKKQQADVVEVGYDDGEITVTEGDIAGIVSIPVEQDRIARETLSAIDIPPVSHSANDEGKPSGDKEIATLKSCQEDNQCQVQVLDHDDASPAPLPLKLAPSSQADDVFGPTSSRLGSLASAQEDKDSVVAAELRDKLQHLLLQCSGGIIDDQTRSSGKTQLQNGLLLPTVEDAEVFRQSWKVLKASVEAVLDQFSPLLSASALEQTRTILQIRDAKVRRFGLLASFGHHHSATEEALSNFLDLLDHSENEESKEAVQQHLVKLEEMIVEAETCAEPVLTDVRIRHQLSQLRHSFQDMVAMSKEGDCKEEPRSDCPSRSSSVSSLLSLSGSASDGDSVLSNRVQTPASISTRPSQDSFSSQFVVPLLPTTPLVHRVRTKSSSSGTYTKDPPSTPRQSVDRRSVSEASSLATPSRLPVAMTRSSIEMPTPKGMTRTESSSSSLNGNGPCTTSQASNFTGRIRSVSDAKRWTKLPIRSPSGTGSRITNHKPSASFANSSKPNQYMANPKSKLDVAVAKIVNKLPMQVNIAHAATTVGTKAVKEQYHDESGRYWVGHPEPKLCFCRILRSRTVMVRIGGGWQELSTYILKHYSHLASDTSISVAPSPQNSPQMDRGNLDKLAWTNGSTLLSTPTGKSALKSSVEYNSPENAYLTPVNERDERRSPSSVRSSRNVTTPQFVPTSIPSASSSPSKLSSLSGQSPETIQGLWIRRDRKTSQARSVSSSSNKNNKSTMNMSTRITSLNYQQRPDQVFDHTRSTVSSRSRKVSSNNTTLPPILARKRVESFSSNSSGNSSVIPSERLRRESLIGSDNDYNKTANKYNQIRTRRLSTQSLHQSS